MPREEAIMEYLKISQDLEMYGVSYFGKAINSYINRIIFYADTPKGKIFVLPKMSVGLSILTNCKAIFLTVHTVYTIDTSRNKSRKTINKPLTNP